MPGIRTPPLRHMTGKSKRKPSARERARTSEVNHLVVVGHLGLRSRMFATLARERDAWKRAWALLEARDARAILDLMLEIDGLRRLQDELKEMISGKIEL